MVIQSRVQSKIKGIKLNYVYYKEGNTKELNRQISKYGNPSNSICSNGYYWECPLHTPPATFELSQFEEGHQQDICPLF